MDKNLYLRGQALMTMFQITQDDLFDWFQRESHERHGSFFRVGRSDATLLTTPPRQHLLLRGLTPNCTPGKECTRWSRRPSSNGCLTTRRVTSVCPPLSPPGRTGALTSCDAHSLKCTPSGSVSRWVAHLFAVTGLLVELGSELLLQRESFAAGH